jgi:hypothetical protein
MFCVIQKESAVLENDILEISRLSAVVDLNVNKHDVMNSRSIQAYCPISGDE